MGNPARTYRSIVAFGLAAGAAVAACNNKPEGLAISVAPERCADGRESYKGCPQDTDSAVPAPAGDASAPTDAQVDDADASSDASDGGGDADASDAAAD